MIQPLYNQSTTAEHYISDHKNCGQKKPGEGPSNKVPCLDKPVFAQGAIKQQIQSSHMPPCHRHMVIATNFSSLFDLLLCSTPQTRAECYLELTTISGYRMFLGPFG